VALDWRDGNMPVDSPVLVALPGLTGCSEVEYMQNIALTMNKSRIRCVIFNNRGLGGIQMKVGFYSSHPYNNNYYFPFELGPTLNC